MEKIQGNFRTNYSKFRVVTMVKNEAFGKIMQVNDAGCPRYVQLLLVTRLASVADWDTQVSQLVINIKPSYPSVNQQ